MRALFGGLAVILGAISIALAARYGYKGADTVVDGTISAVVFGAVALCAFLFDAAAVRLWFMRHRLGAVAIGLIAAAALVVTFTNSLGAIAGRADTTQAQRQNLTDSRADNRRELKRLEDALAKLGGFTPADEETVNAAKRAADTASSNRQAECDKRGPLCKQREIDEASAATALANTTTAKATTDRAKKLETDIGTVKAKLETNQTVGHANPLGNALAKLIGSAADVLTAWQQAVVAAVFELCLVGVMVIYELLGQTRQPGAVRVLDTANHAANLPPPVKTAAKTSKPSKGGGVKGFFRAYLFPADAVDRVDVKSLMHTYRGWCAEKGLAPVDLNAFLDEIEKLCGKLGIKIEVGEDQRVYCLGVRIATPAAAHASVH